MIPCIIHFVFRPPKTRCVSFVFNGNWMMRKGRGYWDCLFRYMKGRGRWGRLDVWRLSRLNVEETPLHSSPLLFQQWQKAFVFLRAVKPTFSDPDILFLWRWLEQQKVTLICSGFYWLGSVVYSGVLRWWSLWSVTRCWALYNQVWLLVLD